MEKPGLDPKLTICKIAVLPIKLYPLSSNYLYYLTINITIIKSS